MAIAHFSYVRCDRCGAPGPMEDDAGVARAAARRQRWSTRTTAHPYDECPACAHGVMFSDECGEFVPVERPKPLATWQGAT